LLARADELISGKQMAGRTKHTIVFANEKGGTGKSTTAVHIAVALAATGHRVAAIDLDHRQRTLSRYLENREGSIRRLGLDMPMPAYATLNLLTPAGLDQEITRIGSDADFVVVDTPGRDDPLTRAAISRADTIVTPINDSFVDLDLIGQVDAETFKVKKLSYYAELIWDLRKVRANENGSSVDWVVLRNRLQHIEANNMKRVGRALVELSKRAGFRTIPGLSERVIYRELFPKGMTLLDMNAAAGFGISHIAARQELREMVGALGLEMHDERQGELELL
jgi:chromosome partitioning protein